MKVIIPFISKTDSTKKIELDFTEKSIKESHIESILQTLRVSFANLRKARAVTQGKGSVRGGGRKPYRQKGTGRARQGSIRNPHFVGGGVAHGPRIRNWSLKIPKTISKNVFRSLFYKKSLEKKLFVIDDVDYFKKTPSIKKFKSFLEKEYKNILIITDSQSMLAKSSRNLKFVSIKSVSAFGAFDILKSDIIIFSASITDKLQKRI